MPAKKMNATCPSGHLSVCASWAVRRFDSLVLSEVPDVALCLCAQGDGAFLRVAPQRYKVKSKSSPPRGTVVPPPSAKSSGSQEVPT
jgi:hypothetical protein